MLIVDKAFSVTDVIKSRHHKPLIFRNCTFEGVELKGNFGNIYFLNSTGTILSSEFSCKSISITDNRENIPRILKFRDSSINNLKKIEIANAYLEYDNVVEPLITELLEIEGGGMLGLQCSDLWASKILLSHDAVVQCNSTKFSADRSYLSKHFIEILCDELTMKDESKITSLGYHFCFGYNGVSYGRIYAPCVKRRQFDEEGQKLINVFKDVLGEAKYNHDFERLVLEEKLAQDQVGNYSKIKRESEIK